MFKRVTYEEWAMLFVGLSFILMFAVFVVTSIRAFLIPKSARSRLASLPLEESAIASTDNPTPIITQP